MSNAIRFLEPYVYDGENMLQLSPGSSASDLTRKVHDVLRIMREDPAQLRARDVAVMGVQTCVFRILYIFCLVRLCRKSRKNRLGRGLRLFLAVNR